MPWNSLDTYRAGLTFFSNVVEQVADQDWQRPSPCDGWDARDVLGHVGAATQMGSRILRGDTFEFTRHDPPGSIVDGEPVTWWRAVAADADDAVAGDLDLGRVVESPMGPRTVGEGLSFPAVDLFVHGWDLATATGGTVTIPDEAIAFARLLFDHVPVETSRQPGVFAAEHAEPADASATEAFIAFTGRDPQWTPTA